MIQSTVRSAHGKGDGSVSKFGHTIKSEKDHRNNPGHTTLTCVNNAHAIFCSSYQLRN